MFDQNWLKRYMLANQVPLGPSLRAEAPLNLERDPGRGRGKPVGVNLRLGHNEEDPPPFNEPPLAESARLRERTGLIATPEVPKLGLAPAPATVSARGGLEALRPCTMPARPLAAQVSAPHRQPASLPGSARHFETASQDPASGRQQVPPASAAPGSLLPGAYVGPPRGCTQPPPAPASRGFFAAAPGPFGYSPFDNSASIQGSFFAFGGEGGMRNYVVMCKDDVEVRASPTYADDTRIGHFLQPGQVVMVDDRRMVTGSWFLHLADGRGWVFETKERLLVMTEAKDFERGLWHYSVVCDDDVETRITPTFSDDARTGLILGSGDCIAVDERCSVAGARFLKLADGRGWVFESKDQLLVMGEVRVKSQEARDFARGLWHYTVVCDDDIEIRAGPTYSDEARTGLMVHPGDCVAVDERCRVGAVWFLRLADGRGWTFESKDSRRVMMQLH